MPGYYRGICVDNKDPQDLGRIRVKVPQVLGPHASGWAFPSWGFHDLTVWPEDRLPRVGDGVWIMFEGTDQMVWTAAFGPQERSQQLLDLLDDPGVYVSEISWNLPTLPEGVSVPITGLLYSPSGTPNPKPEVVIDIDPLGTEAWQPLSPVLTVALDGTFSYDYARSVGSEAQYRVRFLGTGPFQPVVSDVKTIPDPANQTAVTLTWDATTFPWRADTVVTGTLLAEDFSVPRDPPIALYQRIGGDIWTSVATAIPDAGGNWSLTFRREETLPTEYKALFLGSEVYAYAETAIIAEGAVSVPVSLTWDFPSLLVGSVSTFQGVLTSDYGVPEPNATMTFSTRSPSELGEWVDEFTFDPDADGSWSFTYTPVESSADYRVTFPGSGVYQAASTPEEAHIEIYPTSTSVTSAPTAVTYGTPFTVIGSVQDQYARPVTQGEIQLWARDTVSAGSWVQTSAPPVSLDTLGHFLITASLVEYLGDVEIQARYIPTDSYEASESSPLLREVAPASPAVVPDTVSHTTARITWALIAGASHYDIEYQVNSGTWQEGFYGRTYGSYIQSSLASGTKYRFRVRSKGKNSADEYVYSAWSSSQPQMDSGTAEVRKSGSFSQRKVACTGSNSWRANTGWGYIGEDVGQGYFSDPNANYYGVMTYDPTGFKDWVTSTYGADVLNNLTFTQTQVYMVRKSGIGSGSSINSYFRLTNRNAGSGSSTPATSSLDSNDKWALGQSKWVGLPDWWGQRIIFRGTYIISDIKGICVQRSSSADYMQFEGRSSGDACDIRVSCSWDFQVSADVPARWL